MYQYLDATWVAQTLPKRAKNAHKGNFGTLNVLAGSLHYPGAAQLAAAGALRAGAGIVRLVSTGAVCAAAAAALPCCIYQPLTGTPGGGIAAEAFVQNLPLPGAAWLAGPGLGNTQDTAALVFALLQNYGGPLLLDADALNVLAGHLASGQHDEVRQQGLQLLQNLPGTPVLTPHLGELARLCGVSPGETAQNQLGTAVGFAKKYQCVLVAKSHITVVAGPEGEVYVNKGAGNPGLAKGGSGDVLSGIIAALLTQGLPPVKAAAAGVWLHATAGDIAAEQYGETGLSPADLPHCLCQIWRKLGR